VVAANGRHRLPTCVLSHQSSGVFQVSTVLPGCVQRSALKPRVYPVQFPCHGYFLTSGSRPLSIWTFMVKKPPPSAKYRHGKNPFRFEHARTDASLQYLLPFNSYEN
jgi:hypothetical protein